MATERQTAIGTHKLASEPLPGTKLYRVIDGPKGINMFVDTNNTGNALKRVDTSHMIPSPGDPNAHQLSREEVEAELERLGLKR